MPLITNPADVITHILQHEVQHDVTETPKILVSTDSGTSDATVDVAGDKMAFTVHDKQINSKKLIEGIASNTRLIPYIKNGEIRYRSYLLNPDEENLSHPLINSDDIISYTNKRTAPEKVYTKVIVNYHYDYVLKEFQATTENNTYSDSIIDYIDNAQNGSPFQDFGALDPDTYLSSLGLKSEQEYPGGFDAHYIRKEGDTPDDDTTAIELQKFLLLWHCNQHNILKLRMPLKYIRYNVGDYVGFDKLINGVKLFGEDYSSVNIRNGQQILPVWMITSLNKTLTHIDVEMIQMHNCIGELQNFLPVAKINGGTSFAQEYATSDCDGVDEIVLDGSESFDPDGDAITYNWDFEDGDPLPEGTTGFNTPLLTIQNPSITDTNEEGTPVTHTHILSLRVTDTEEVESDRAYATIHRTDTEVQPMGDDLLWATEILDPLYSLKMLGTEDWVTYSIGSSNWRIGYSQSQDWDFEPGWERRREYYISLGWSGAENRPIPDAAQGDPISELDFQVEVSEKPSSWEVFEEAFPLATLGIVGCRFTIHSVSDYINYGTPPYWQHALKSDIPIEVRRGEHGFGGRNFSDIWVNWNRGYIHPSGGAGALYPASAFPDSGASLIPTSGGAGFAIRHAHSMGNNPLEDFGYTIGLPYGLAEHLITAGLAEDEDGASDWWERQIVEYTYRFCVGVYGCYNYLVDGGDTSGALQLLLLPELGYLDINVRHYPRIIDSEYDPETHIDQPSLPTL